MILFERVVFDDGHKLIELNRAQTLDDVPQSLVEPTGTMVISTGTMMADEREILKPERLEKI